MDERFVRGRSRSREAGGGWTRERGLFVAVGLLALVALAAWTAGLGLPGSFLRGLADRLADAAGAIAWRSVPSLGLLVGASAIGLLLLGAGVSNRSRAERAARESEARMARMVDSAMDAVISLDGEQRIRVFNRAAEEMFQRPAAAVIGQPIDMLLPPRFREAHRHHIERFGTAAVTSRSMGSLSGLRADGQEFPIEASISRVEVGGERIYTAIIRDISARVRTEKALQESEEMLRLSLEATGMGIWALDPRTGERRWSARSKALFGLPPGAEVDGETIMGRVHPADRGRLEQIMATLLRPGSVDELDIEFRLAATEGREERWLHSRGRVLFEDGQAVRVVGTLLDITGRRRAEEAIRGSEGRYRTLFECAPDGILIADRESYYTSANPSLCRMLGYSPDEVVGMHASDIVVPEEVEHIAPALETINAGAAYHREWRFRRRDGSTFPAEVIAASMPEGDIMAMIRDVTERRVAEQALRESEERFRTMANSMVQLAWIARPDGYIHWYNERWYEYTGTTPEQMAGWGWQSVHDPVMLPSVIARWTEAIATGARFEMEFPLRGADGRFRTFLTRGQPLKDGDGRVVQWFGTNTDVDALKRAEERVRRLNAELEQRVAERTAQLEAAVTELEESRAELQSLFESLPGLYLVLTPDLVIVAVSDAYLDATMTTRETILGRHLFDVFPDNPDAPDIQAVAAMQASLERVIREGRPDTMALQRHDVRRPDGTFEERYWSPINSPMFGAGRRIKYLVHRVEEVTDFVRQRATLPAGGKEPEARMQQMEAEIFQSSRKLQAANLELEAANKELEAFSYSVSHDLRAPLRGVNGYVRIIQEDYGDRLDAEGNRLLDVVAGQAKHMGELIDDLLEFSRLGRTPMRRRRVEMTELARIVFEGLTCIAQGAPPRLALAPLPPAQGDAAMLRQVYANLLGNAIKFSRDSAEPVIEVGASPASAEHAPAEVVYHVKDNGAGFDSNYGHKLFGVFERLHTDEQFEGTGVGLALVQRIIHRHGGRVWAEGTPGQGATFYFTLPPRREDEA